MNMPHKDTQTNEDSFNIEQEARRRLLKMAVYIPPAILGVMVSGNVAHAGGGGIGTTKKCGGGGTIIVSAGGNACCPCVSSDPNYNPIKCNQAKCKIGNCAACKTLIFAKKKDCLKKAATCGTCVQVGGSWIIQ